MARVILRGFAERKARTASLLITIILGVALIAGSYVYGDTIDRSFDSLVTETNTGVDVKVTAPEGAVQTEEDPTLPATLADRVRRVDGVAEAAGTLDSFPAVIVDRKGESLATAGPGFAVSAAPDQFDPLDYQGRAPRTDGELAVDRGTAERGKFALGDSVRVALQGPARSYRLVGIGTLGDVSSIGGASVSVLTLAELQRASAQPGRISEIAVAAETGTTPTELRDRIKEEVGRGVVVRTGEQDTQAQLADIDEFTGILTTFLLAFGLVSLVVGAFSIFNTFSITVAQRMRQFALLRMVGASRAQILRAVVVEALLLGLIGSVLGLAAGIGMAPLLNLMFEAFGVDLPSDEFVISTRTIVVSLLVGTLSTLLASLGPALRATRVPPVAALREGALAPAAGAGKRRLIAGGVVTALGVAVLCAGLFGGGGTTSVLTLMGAGALLAFIGVALLAPALVTPLAGAIGAPLERVGGVAGRIARGNSVRNPGRTASTAAALMIGVALVALVSMLAAGLKASFSGAFEEAVVADLVVTDDFGLLPAAVGRDLSRVPGVAAASPLTFGEAQLVKGREDTEVLGLDPVTGPQVLKVPWQEGSDATLRDLGTDGALLDEQWAEDHDLRVGSSLVLRAPRSRTVRLTVAGIYDDRGGLLGPITLAQPVVREAFGARQDGAVLLAVADGQQPAAVQRAINRQLDRQYPTLESKTGAAFVDDQVGQVDQILLLFYGLLSLAVIIALFGIANTLALSVYERTRELGLLRALGASRRQIRRIVRGEAIITALIGGVIGVVVGVAFAAIMGIPLAEEGFVFTLPVVTLVTILVVAAVCGVLAATSPARRASRVDVLTALQYE